MGYKNLSNFLSTTRNSSSSKERTLMKGQTIWALDMRTRCGLHKKREVSGLVCLSMRYHQSMTHTTVGGSL